VPNGVMIPMMPRVSMSSSVNSFMSMPGIDMPTASMTGSSAVTCAVTLANR
jgi:hypothetical protein